MTSERSQILRQLFTVFSGVEGRPRPVSFTLVEEDGCFCLPTGRVARGRSNYNRAGHLDGSPALRAHCIDLFR